MLEDDSQKILSDLQKRLQSKKYKEFAELLNN